MMTAGLAGKLLTLEQWCIGWAKVDIAAFLDNPSTVDFTWLRPRHRAELLADPFGYEENGTLTIFAERLIYGQTKGRLVRIAAESATASPAPLLERPFHLSYPFVVEEDGRAYVVPEQGESNRLAFYPLDGAGLGAPVTLIEGLDAVDPTFLWHEGLWWLFCTRRSQDPNRALYLYFAERLLGPYRPHPGNPVVTEAAHARPAGRIIRRDAALLRPAQDCTQSYGAAITLCAIDTLSPERYSERPVRRLSPADIRGGYSAGLHTLDHTAHYVLIDTKRTAFAPFAAPLKLVDRMAGRHFP